MCAGRGLSVRASSESTSLSGYGAEALLLAGDLEAADAQLAEAFRVAQTLGERTTSRSLP